MTEWFPIETAPKDRPVLFAGKWKKHDIYPGGDWFMQIFRWGSFSSAVYYPWNEDTGASFKSGFDEMDHWHVDWSHWADLPEPPMEK